MCVISHAFGPFLPVQKKPSSAPSVPNNNSAVAAVAAAEEQVKGLLMQIEERDYEISCARDLVVVHDCWLAFSSLVLVSLIRFLQTCS